ncbi:uncharacterized protein LOC142342487 isoform X2 [Convolutriloba macropyga]|uniref:uncharacterized protein LOC142342487 isoform X2 n=1 Tax=Convolutriloba macropyga TaxID=536237 RepID=UPI003F522B01
MKLIFLESVYFFVFVLALSSTMVFGEDESEVYVERRGTSQGNNPTPIGKRCNWETLKAAEKICECECQNGQTEDDRTDCTAMCKEPLENALKIKNCVNLKSASFDQSNEDCKYDGFDMQRPLVTFGNIKTAPKKKKKSTTQPPKPAPTKPPKNVKPPKPAPTKPPKNVKPPKPAPTKPPKVKPQKPINQKPKEPVASKPPITMKPQPVTTTTTTTTTSTPKPQKPKEKPAEVKEAEEEDKTTDSNFPNMVNISILMTSLLTGILFA